MLRLTWKNLWAHKGRLALTTLAVTLGVSFVSSAFILTDSLNNTFDELASDIAGNVDLQVRDEDYDLQELDIRPVPVSLTEPIQALPDVDVATPTVGTGITALREDDEPINSGDFGPPNLAFAFEGEGIGAFDLVDGAAPVGNQVLVDVDTVEEYELAIGDTVRVTSFLAAPDDYEISGTVVFGEDSSFGARYFLFDLGTAQKLAGIGSESVQTIDVRLVDGGDLAATRAAVGELLAEAGAPAASAEVIDRDQIVEEITESFGTFLDTFRWVLLVFAIIALVVSIFVIANTFSIVLGQRVRELGLLRALGAGTRQVTVSVMLEAVVVGIVASVVGLLVGRGIARLLSQLISSSGDSSVSMVVLPRTLWVAFLVGVVITTLAAVLPAIRAGRISPMAALAEGYSLRSGRSRTVRFIIGAVLTAVGVAVVIGAVVAGPDDTIPLIIMTVGGALVVIVGVAMLSPTIARPFAAAVGHPAFAVGVSVLAVLVAGLAVYQLIGTQQDLWSDPDLLEDIRTQAGSGTDDLSDTALRLGVLGSAVGGLLVAGLALWILSLPLLSFTKPEARLNVWWRRLIRGVLVIVLVGLVLGGLFMSMSGLGTFPFLLATAAMLFMAGRAGRGIPGRIARGNAMNNPRRTASTATSLMIGLALISTTLVVAASLKASFTETLGSAVQADYFVYTNQFDGFAPSLADELEAVPEVEAVGRYRQTEVEVGNDGRVVRMWGTTEVGLDGMLDLDIKEGSTEGLDDGGILVHKDPAKDLDLSIGDTLDLTFQSTDAETQLTVVGIHQDASMLENWVIPLDVFDENTLPTEDRDAFVALNVSAGIQASRPALDQVMEDYPEVNLEDIDEFTESQEGFLNQGLTIINVMLGLAVVIALIGIANTIALSVYERTRELGLVRAVGMQPAQVRQMIRWEAVVIAVFGALVGMAIGMLFGYTIVALLPDSVINTWGFPTSQFLAVLAASVVVGIGAAYLPARRAGRLDVLDAIAQE